MVMKIIQANSTAMFQFFLRFGLCATQDKDKSYDIVILLLTILCCLIHRKFKARCQILR